MLLLHQVLTPQVRVLSLPAQFSSTRQLLLLHHHLRWLLLKSLKLLQPPPARPPPGLAQQLSPSTQRPSPRHSEASQLQLSPTQVTPPAHLKSTATHSSTNPPRCNGVAISSLTLARTLSTAEARLDSISLIARPRKMTALLRDLRRNPEEWGDCIV